MFDNWFVHKLQNPLVIFGMFGQCVFMMRFVVQWIASERRGRSVVPVAFWYLSIGGGVMVFTYGVLDQDPVVMLGQGLGLMIYIRNLWMIYARSARIRARRDSA